MVRKARIAVTIVCFFAIELGILLYLQERAAGVLSAWQLLLLVGCAGIFGALLSSLVLSLTISLPLRSFRKTLVQTWHDKQTLPPMEGLPKELAQLEQSLVEIVGGMQKNLTTLGESKQLEDAKYQFIAIANHQLHTPLSEIHWATQSLAEMQTNPDAQVLIQKLQESIARITVIIEQFLAVAELSSGDDVEKRTSLDAGTIVVNTVDRFMAIAKQKGMMINIKVAPTLVASVAADERLLGFVVETLVTNAIIYGSKGTNITIHLRNDDAKLYLSVEDTGITLAPDVSTMLFEKFFRSEEARRARPDGSGLALYISKRIVERLGGTIAAHSEANRVIFEVMLPLEAKEKLRQFVGAY